MPSPNKSPKTKSIKKSVKSSHSQIKPQLAFKKSSSFKTIFKTLEFETACELPKID